MLLLQSKLEKTAGRSYINKSPGIIYQSIEFL